MSNLRDSLVPLTDLGNKLSSKFGLSRFQVILRRRTWSGDKVGSGVPTNDDLVLTPPPDVSFQSPFAAQMSGILTSGGSIRDRYYKVEQITPAYTKNGVSGGYTPQQLRMRVPQGVANVEALVVLIGDDGMARVCTQVLLEDGDPFAYSMTLQEKDKDSIGLVSIACTIPPWLQASNKAQLIALGTYDDGSVYDITPLARWTSSDPSVAKVDLLGNAIGVAAGSVTIGAAIGRTTSPPLSMTVTP